ncbi:MAG: YlmC/YmxH family sporulation protein, partial [Tumebacillaceae bacterium]
MAGKEMIYVKAGTRNGVLGSADLVIDEETGAICSIVLAQSGFSFGKKREETVIPWSAILRVGPDMIILDTVEDNDMKEGRFVPHQMSGPSE